MIIGKFVDNYYEGNRDGQHNKTERNGDLLGHYIGCKKPHKKIEKNDNLMNI